ncbi:MAG: tRNA (guanosine(37)-N1)-methyltransferase TrmD [Firmicutes bacterium]|nr:tRNA (guanosine(37)-N1)-methyltransferase TrmD [Bacillota bacterium]
MQIDILTIFPTMFAPLNESIVGRARAAGLLKLSVHNIRDYATDKHHMTDDRPYGGGAGMVMKPEPIFLAARALINTAKPRLIITSPQGHHYTQALAREFADEEQLIIICGHYEGIDERVIEGLATDVISVGDFVLTGGEIAALLIADSVARLLPGVLGHEESALEDSFSGGLLEYPHYTRPPYFEGMEVPLVLQSGDHAAIKRWRREKAVERTFKYRPELLACAPLSEEEAAYAGILRQQHKKAYKLFIALLHYPVLNKKKQVINTSLTNLDLHDIARACATYGVANYYLIQPIDIQRQLMADLLAHWQEGFGAQYNPDRGQALELVKLCPTLKEACMEIENAYGAPPRLIATSARDGQGSVTCEYLRNLMESEGGNYLLLLGTGWGLAPTVMEFAEFRLQPIYGAGNYNHLSVRSAASIILDRIVNKT